MRVVSDLRASGKVTDRAIALATLNTLYALTAGTAMLRSIDRGDTTMLASLASSAAVLGVSLLVGALLAALLVGAFKLLHPTSQDTAIVILALIGACTAVTTPLGGSAPLATLLAGIVLKQLQRRPGSGRASPGAAAAMLNVLMFVLVSLMAAQADWHGALTWAALALVAARMAAKLLSLLLTGPASGLSLRQSLWVGVALVPMSSVALLLTSQFVVASHSVGARVAAIALPVILITELLGAVLVGLALVRARSRQAVAPQRSGRRRQSTRAAGMTLQLWSIRGADARRRAGTATGQHQRLRPGALRRRHAAPDGAARSARQRGAGDDGGHDRDIDRRLRHLARRAGAADADSRRAGAVRRQLNIAVVGGGTHPFQQWHQQRIYDKPRFHGCRSSTAT